MIMDKECVLVTDAALNLETVRPGPGKPIKMCGDKLTPNSTVTIKHCVTEGGTYTNCTTAVADGMGFVEFDLPASTKQYIKCTFTVGTIFVSLEGCQSNR